MSFTLRRPSGPCWNRKGPCASPMPTSPASVVSLTMTSLTRVMRWVDVLTACGNGADSRYVSRLVTFIDDRLRSPGIIGQGAGRDKPGSLDTSRRPGAESFPSHPGESDMNARDESLERSTARKVLTGVAMAVALSAGAAPALAEPRAPNRTYAGGTRVEAPSLGVAFVIPEGWAGKFGQDATNQVVVMGSNTLEGVGLAILQAGQSAAQLAASLAEPQDLGDGVVLRPSAPPDRQGSRITARYQNNIYVGRALAVVGSTGNSVGFFFAGPLKNEGAYGQLVEGMARSTSFGAPAPATAQPETADGSGAGQAWSQRLTGQMLHYFSTYNSGGGGGGMATHRVLHLCGDGRFSYSGDSSLTMNVPGASASGGGRSGSRGQWRIESPTPTTAVLVLTADGGSPMRWPLRYDGEKTFLNGQRWLRAKSDLCQ